MAYVQTLVSRVCPQVAFTKIEDVVADTVGPVVYGQEYPDDADVDVSVHPAKLGTFMALKVEIDTEDLPGRGWFITESGLCVKAANRLSEGSLRVPKSGLSDAQRDKHFGIQAKTIHDRLVDHDIWSNGTMGWADYMNSSLKLGVLVCRSEGAWYASYTSGSGIERPLPKIERSEEKIEALKWSIGRRVNINKNQRALLATLVEGDLHGRDVYKLPTSVELADRLKLKDKMPQLEGESSEEYTIRLAGVIDARMHRLKERVQEVTGHEVNTRLDLREIGLIFGLVEIDDLPPLLQQT